MYGYGHASISLTTNTCLLKKSKKQYLTQVNRYANDS
jgi:hypothetical protein